MTKEKPFRIALCEPFNPAIITPRDRLLVAEFSETNQIYTLAGLNRLIAQSPDFGSHPPQNQLISARAALTQALYGGSKLENFPVFTRPSGNEATI